MSKQEAAVRFAQLIKKYGVTWTSGKVPSQACQEILECNKFLSEKERNLITFKVLGVGSSG